MKHMKRNLALLLALAMAITLTAVPVFADEPANEEAYEDAYEEPYEVTYEEPYDDPELITLDDNAAHTGGGVMVDFGPESPPMSWGWSTDMDGNLLSFEINDVEIPIWDIDGETYVRLRYVAQAVGVQVAWDATNETVIATFPTGDVLTIVVAEIGGFNENGVVWAPIEEGVELFIPYWGGIRTWEAWAPIEVRDDIPYAVPVTRTTDHGQIATDFLVKINDYFYNRVPFSYRELEKAEWLVDVLIDMGHDANNIYMQTFAYDDVTRWLNFWHEIYQEYNVFVTDARPSMEDMIEDMIAETLHYLPINLAAEGLTMEEFFAMLAEILEIPEFDMDAYIEFARQELERGFLGFLADYGIFDPYTIFRPYSQNVLLTIPGQSDYTIVVTAHKDGVLNPGASDNASGVALLLEGAYRLLNYGGNYHTIVFAFVGAEEVGLVGAYYYLESLTRQERDSIILNINADVLLEGPYFFFGTAVTGYEGSDANDITGLITAIAQMLNAEYGTALIEEVSLAQMPSDQLVFFHAGHPVIALTGLARDDSPEYAAFPNRGISQNIPHRGSVLHTPYDCVHVINAHWPEKIGDAFWTFGLFLEYLLLIGANG